jgi:peptide/nickel transport system permease protein
MSAIGIEFDAASAPSVDSPRFSRRLLKNKVAAACLGFLALVLAIAVIAPFALPHVASERAGDLLATHQGPSARHLLGTDTLGRDVLNRLLVGTRITVIGVAEALVTVILLGIPAGLAAGYLGGSVDKVVSRLVDLAFGIPAIILILIVLAVFPGSMLAAMVAFGILAAPGLIRVVRSTVLPVKEELYIAAARVSGLSRRQIVQRHVLPRVSGPVIVQLSLLAAGALLLQTGLSFLGLLVPAPAPSWGGMVADGWSVIVLQPWLLWPPGAAIALTILALGLLGDSVRDAAVETWSAPARSPRRPARTKSKNGYTFPPPETLLAVHSLSVGFPVASGGIRRVVEDVTFEVKPGETVGVVGESGSGKTMTVMAILGLLPANGVVEKGAIYFRRRDLTQIDERELHGLRGNAMSLISQEPMASLNPALRVGSQLAEVVRRHHRVSRAEARARSIDLLRQVQLPDPEIAARQFPHELSGGMAQRISIARALAGEPELLLADEPTTALDVTLQGEILDLLRELQRDRGMGILLVTHDWGVVADICDRAIVMYAGQVVERAYVEQVFRRPFHPYTDALLSANPYDAPPGQLLPMIPGVVPQPGSWPQGCHFHPRCAYATATCRVGPIPIVTPASTPERETRCIHHDRLTIA